MPDNVTVVDHPLVHAGLQFLECLPGVGRALTDHPLTAIELRATDTLARQMELFSRDRWTPDEQTILKTQSPRCDDAFDLHLYGILRPDPAVDGDTVQGYGAFAFRREFGHDVQRRLGVGRVRDARLLVA